MVAATNAWRLPESGTVSRVLGAYGDEFCDGIRCGTGVVATRMAAEGKHIFRQPVIK